LDQALATTALPLKPLYHSPAFTTKPFSGRSLPFSIWIMRRASSTS
jgi:hypothetical protein